MAATRETAKMTRRKCAALRRSLKHGRLSPSDKIQAPIQEMKKCLGQLKRMVPTIEQHQKINQLELLQHVINYIQDLEVTLDHPAQILASKSPCREGTDSGHIVQT
ncbi:unnamed protein product [Dicrocoelium dendriticum]|nr:unnamed protein product [Dicrocoelium dendriticum]